MCTRPKKTFLQRRRTDGQEAHEKMLNITNYLLLFSWLFATPWTAAHQTSLFLTTSQSFPKFMSLFPLSWLRGLHNPMKLWAMPCRATQDRQVIADSSDKMWSTGEGNSKPPQYTCPENLVNCKKALIIREMQIKTTMKYHLISHGSELRSSKNL